MEITFKFKVPAAIAGSIIYAFDEVSKEMGCATDLSKEQVLRVDTDNKEMLFLSCLAAAASQNLEDQTLLT